eukprot:Tbor_TRINITY_DN5343_c1_g1::TRINITY_DN5343_c1_g1_i1::g.4511::m.4511/K19685/TTC26, IFT56, DYF13; intraflagellar transport protein 56
MSLINKRRPVKVVAPAASSKVSVTAQFEDALRARDFSKAVAMLEFFRSLNQTIGELPINPWLGYSAFHMGDFTKAAEIYKEMLIQDDCDPVHWLHLACCYFGNGLYREAQEAAKKGPAASLRNRLLFHISQKLDNEKAMTEYHAQLEDTVEDQLSLAAMHYFRNHFQDATDIYKSIMLASRDYLALNVYVALCYYKLDYYDVSLEVLNVYLQSHSDSPIAINLKACNHYRLYNGKAAETELRALMDQSTYNIDNDIVRHNLVVFRNGEDALQTLPALVDVVVPEARLNLVVYHLRNDQVQEAYDLIKDTEPTTPQEHILIAVVNSLIGQQLDSRDHLKTAREYFQVVGASPSECDTIPGRQCMASCFFLLKNYSDVMVYLSSIKPYFGSDDTFLYLYGITCAATGNYVDAEESLTAIRSESIRQEYSFISWLVRTHIMTKHTKKAWELYLKMDTNAESFSMLKLIANDCYKIGAFYYAAKAFDVLERLDTAQEYVDGLRGSCVGVLQQVAANKEPPESVWDVARMLEASAKAHQEGGRQQHAQQTEKIMTTIRSWARDNTKKK